MIPASTAGIFYYIPIRGIIQSYLHFISLLRTFAVLIKKDGGIRPCDVLATCADKVLHSIPNNREQISESHKSGFSDISKNSLVLYIVIHFCLMIVLIITYYLRLYT